MKILNITLVILFQIVSQINSIDLHNPLSLDQVLIQFNVITFVSMVGVTLTFVFTVLFFRKIKNDFDKKCLHDSYIIDADALTTQQTEFRRLANVLKFWSATILICCTIITLRFVHILPYIESLKTGN